MKQTLTWLDPFDGSWNHPYITGWLFPPLYTSIYRLHSQGSFGRLLNWWMDVTAIFINPTSLIAVMFIEPNISDIHKSKLLTALGQKKTQKLTSGRGAAPAFVSPLPFSLEGGPNCDCTRWEDDVTWNLPRNLTWNLKVPLLEKGTHRYKQPILEFHVVNFQGCKYKDHPISEVMSCWKVNHPKRDHIIILNLSLWFVSNTSKQKEMRQFNQNRFNHGMLTYPLPLLVPLVISR